MDNNEKTIWRCPECETINSGEKCVVCGMGMPLNEQVPIDNKKIKKSFVDALLWLDLAVIIFILIIIYIKNGREIFWNNYELSVNISIVCLGIGFVCKLDVNRIFEKKFVAISFLGLFLTMFFLEKIGVYSICFNYARDMLGFWSLIGFYIGSILRIKVKKKYRSGEDE